MKTGPKPSKQRKPSSRQSLTRSRLIPEKMKAVIMPYVTSSSRYNNGRLFGLSKPASMLTISKMADRVSMGADKNGFFVYTHRARCKSYKSPMLIPKKDIDFIETTG